MEEAVGKETSGDLNKLLLRLIKVTTVLSLTWKLNVSI
jgi:hypothetical protein